MPFSFFIAKIFKPPPPKKSPIFCLIKKKKGRIFLVAADFALEILRAKSRIFILLNLFLLKRPISLCGSTCDEATTEKQEKMEQTRLLVL